MEVSQQTQDVEPMLVLCWVSVVDDGPTLTHHWFSASPVCWVYIYEFKKNTIFMKRICTTQ